MPLTYGLFETMADVCATVEQLRKLGFADTSLSLLARDLEADSGEQDDRRPTVAQVVKALELTPVADSLLPTALVVIPEAGTYLTAGWPVQLLVGVEKKHEYDVTTLDVLFREIGCQIDEATFLGGRLQSGAILLGASGTELKPLVDAREVFAEQQAVYVGLLEDDSASNEGWARIEIPGLDSHAAGGAIVVDVSATKSDEHESIGKKLEDDQGLEIGTISHAIFDSRQERERIARYLVVEHGGILGVGRQLHAIPASLIDTAVASDRFQVRVSLDTVENGPAYDARLPLSRREEQTICAYYGTTPYWDE